MPVAIRCCTIFVINQRFMVVVASLSNAAPQPRGCSSSRRPRLRCGPNLDGSGRRLQVIVSS
jgi:hypothetical protein